MIGYVYLTTNLITGKKYIGQHVSKKFDPSYLGSGALMIKAIHRHGRANFKVEIIETAETKEELNQLEINCIQRHNAVEDDNYYNIDKGGSRNTGNYIWVTNGRQDKLIPPEQLNKYLSKGYQQGFKQGAVNKGKTVVTKNGVDKFIDIRELDNYLSMGYEAGRHICPTQGKIIINKDGKEKRILESDLPNYISLGYRKGRAVSTTKGRIRVYKNGVEKLIEPQHINTYISEGWQRGTLLEMPKVDCRGKIWITNGIERHYINPDQLEKFPGYRRGMKLSKEGSTTIENINK